MLTRYLQPLLFAALLLFPHCGTKERTEQGAPSSGNIAEVTTVERRQDKAPNFSWKDASGKTVDFDSYRGDVTLVNFWATWCGPCLKELPDLIALQKELGPRNVKILGISTDRGSDVIEEVHTFVKNRGITYQVVISSSELEEAFGTIRAIPASFLIDKNGTITQKIIGIRNREFFSSAILALLK